MSVSQQRPQTVQSLEEEEHAGRKLSAAERIELMAKLERSHESAVCIASCCFSDHQLMSFLLQPKTHVVAAAEFIPVSKMQAVECLVLKNMWDPQTTADSEYADIEMDVKEKAQECGAIIHLHLDRVEGFVYLRFDSANSAQNMMNSINGRFYAGRQVTAEFLPPAIYSMKFPQSQAQAQQAAQQAFLSAH